MKYVKHEHIDNVHHQTEIKNPFDEISRGTIYEIRDNQMDFYIGLDHIPGAEDDPNPKLIGWWYEPGTVRPMFEVSFPPHIKFATIPNEAP